MLKGYIPTDGKIPKRAGLILEDKPISGDYVGVLKADIVQVDIDSEADAELLYQIVMDEGLECTIINTSRGKHFYFTNRNMDKFKSRRQGVNTPIGIKIDFGTGLKNSTCPLRVKGVDREILQWFDEPCELPPWLIPMNHKIDFKSLDSGRNSKLFSFILDLHRFGLNKQEVRDTITIINDYILPEPLSDSEIETITRDDAFPKDNFFEDGRFLHDVFADTIMGSESIVKFKGELYSYDDRRKIYVGGTDNLEKIMLKKLSFLKSAQRKEVLAYIKLRCINEVKEQPLEYIAVKNGILNIQTDELLPFTPSIFVTSRIETEYNPLAKSDLVDTTLDNISCNDAELRQTIEEMLGYTLLRSNNLGKLFMLSGCGSNGKSTFLMMISEMLGQDNVSRLEPKDFSQRFVNAQLSDKLANIGDDISNEHITNTSLIKKLCTGEEITVENKQQTPFVMRNYATLIFACNDYPRFNDFSFGFLRRLIFIPFNANFSRDNGDYDPFIEYKLKQKEPLEYLLLLSLAGLKRIMKDGFFIGEKSKEEFKRFLLHNDPIENFIYNAMLDGYDFSNKPTSDVYTAYKLFCAENGNSTLGKIKFINALKNKLNLKVKRTEGNVERFIKGDNQ